MDLKKRYEEQEKKNRNAGILGTLASVGLILAVLFSLGLYYQIPPPEEQSIDVIFGDPDAGMNSDPSTDPASSSESPSNPQPDQDLTQDFEDAPTINQNPSNPSEVTTNTDQPQTQPTRQIRLPNLSGRQEGGSGNNNRPGQQGDPNGGEDGDIYGTGGNGNANGLGGRGITRKPTAKAECTEKGKIMVRITVSPQGKVINARYEAEGSTTSNTTCVNEALQLAKQWEYEPIPGNTGNATGLITIELR